MCNVGFETESGRFRFRGVGIVIKDGKVLMVRDEKRKYYYAIGGTECWILLRKAWNGLV